MLVRSIYAAISLLAMMGCSVAVTIPKLDKTDPEIVVKQDALKKVKTIAIIAFQDSGKSELKKPVDHDGNYIAEAITFELAKTFRFKMIDRNAIETIMKERQITASTLSSRDIKELGEVLGAEVIMTGQINQCGTAETWKRNRNGYVSATIAFVNFDFKLMDTQSSEVLAFGKVRLNSQQIMKETVEVVNKAIIADPYAYKDRLPSLEQTVQAAAVDVATRIIKESR